MNCSDRNRVLVVDDDRGIRLLLLAYLRRGGFHLLEACNGREALETMHAATPDCVVMDLMMPEVSGLDVLRERAADPSLQRIPMIVITANASREVIAGVLEKDVYAVLTKPFDLDALLTAVTACLEQPHAPTLIAA